MPLHGLVHALRRITYDSPNDINAPHPLHALIEPLLLTARSAAHKYHTELTAILAEGGGAGEAEEAMMWFAYEHEKHEAASSASGQPSSSQQSNDPGSNEDADAQWQARWLNRMERRECVMLFVHASEICGSNDRFKQSANPNPPLPPQALPSAFSLCRSHRQPGQEARRGDAARYFVVSAKA